MTNKSKKSNSKKADNVTRNMTPETIAKLAAETGIQSTWKPSDTSCPICETHESVYMLDDNRTYYCIECCEEFQVLHSGEIVTGADSEDWTEDFKSVNDAASKLIDGQKQLPGFTHKNTTDLSNWLPGKTEVKKYCTHKPTHVIAGRNWGVWAGKKFDVEDLAKDFDVVLNLTFTPIKERRVIPIPELRHWESYHASFDEIQIDWPDYGISTLPREFWDELVTYLCQNKKRLLVFCMGGHGRTGTAVASMMVCALGWSANRAINWVRENYCFEAIETKSQEAYVRAIDRAGKKAKAKTETA